MLPKTDCPIFGEEKRNPSIFNSIMHVRSRRGLNLGYLGLAVWHSAGGRGNAECGWKCRVPRRQVRTRESRKHVISWASRRSLARSIHSTSVFVRPLSLVIPYPCHAADLPLRPRVGIVELTDTLVSSFCLAKQTFWLVLRRSSTSRPHVRPISLQRLIRRKKFLCFRLPSVSKTSVPNIFTGPQTYWWGL